MPGLQFGGIPPRQFGGIPPRQFGGMPALAIGGTPLGMVESCPYAMDVIALSATRAASNMLGRIVLFKGLSMFDAVELRDLMNSRAAMCVG
jgi:hypothetical protein